MMGVKDAAGAAIFSMDDVLWRRHCGYISKDPPFVRLIDAEAYNELCCVLISAITRMDWEAGNL